MKPKSAGIALATATLWLLLPFHAKAQSERPFNGQIVLDMRGLIASKGQSRSGLYGSGLSVNGKLGKGWKLHFNGAQNNAPTITASGAHFDKFVTQEANLEYAQSTSSFSAGVLRLPFGLYDHQEMYASGLIDYPLLRADFALQALDWGVFGAQYLGYKGSWQWQTSAFGGQSAGIWGNINNTSGVSSRVQAYAGKGMIFGLSRWDGTSSTSFTAGGPQGTHLTGVDVRFTRPHLLLRGEYAAGQSAGETFSGYYLDAFYHLPKFNRWTLAARYEALSPQSSGDTTRQTTLGIRYTLSRDWVIALNWRQNNGPSYSPSWTPTTRAGGDFYFQAYRKIGF